MIATTANSSKNSTPFLKGALLLCTLGLLAGCARLPAHTDYPTQKLVTGPGPEDMVLDTLTDPSHPRLLVSCAARRKTEAPHGEIWVLDLHTEQAAVFPRKGEPAGTVLHPHGIDLIRRPDGIHLYVINHQDSLKRQTVMEYLVQPDRLDFVALYENALLSSPNDVCADPQGGFYWSNDASNRKNAFIEPVFGIRGGYVGHHTDSVPGRWSRSRSRFAYTNGIGVRNGDLYISTVIQSTVFRFNHCDLNQKPEKTARVTGGDNLTFLPDGRILVTAHLRQLKFLAHLKKSANKSPSTVYLIDPATKAKKVVYADDGHTISTASTAVYYDGHLYICQVFDGFIIKAKTGTL